MRVSNRFSVNDRKRVKRKRLYSVKLFMGRTLASEIWWGEFQVGLLLDSTVFFPELIGETGFTVPIVVSRTFALLETFPQCERIFIPKTGLKRKVNFFPTIIVYKQDTLGGGGGMLVQKIILNRVGISRCSLINYRPLCYSWVFYWCWSVCWRNSSSINNINEELSSFPGYNILQTVY